MTENMWFWLFFWCGGWEAGLLFLGVATIIYIDIFHAGARR